MIPPGTKGLPPAAARELRCNLGSHGYNLLTGDIPLPACVLNRAAISHNRAVMREFTKIRAKFSETQVLRRATDQVIGTFNVESPQPEAFDDRDREFIEIYGRNIAAALNTLELLEAEKAGK